MESRPQPRPHRGRAPAQRPQLAEAEIFLERAAVDAKKRGHSAPKRVQVRLLLADAQRKQLHLDRAERTLRAAIEIAARTDDHVAYLRCLDALTDILEGNAERVRERIASLTPTAK